MWEQKTAPSVPGEEDPVFGAREAKNYGLSDLEIPLQLVHEILVQAG